MTRIRIIAAVVCLCAFAAPQRSGATNGAKYLFVWAGDEARKASDFLSVIDVDERSSRYSTVVATTPIGATGTMPHHTEYEFPRSNRLFANGWVAGRTFVFDLSNPVQPRITSRFEGRGGYIYPHSFTRLPNGNVLATFQSMGRAYAPGGGLVELNEAGEIVRSVSAADESIGADFVWPYSLDVNPTSDQVLVSDSIMGMPDWAMLPDGSWPLKKLNEFNTWHVQLFSLSGLKLRQTIELPPDAGNHHWNPAEPRFLPDRSAYVNTFTCGLFHITDLAGSHPKARLVQTFPGGTDMDTLCAVPVIVGHYWIQTVAKLPGLVVLDIRDPEKPVEVSRLQFPSEFHHVHWLAADRAGDRLVVTGSDESWVLLLHFDPNTGTARFDERFGEKGTATPGISFDRKHWPHGEGGRALVHGALFGPA